MENVSLPPEESYAEIGQLLRSARLQLRLSPEKAANLLHIRVRYIEALEEGRLTELPGPTYTKGYLQSYATLLGLDKDEILRRFEEMDAMLARKNFYFPQVFSKEKTPSNWMVWGGLAGAFGVYLLWHMFLQPPVREVSQVEKFPPPPPPRITISGKVLRDVACLNAQDVLYPPCTRAVAPDFSLLPMHGQYDSILNFGIMLYEPVEEPETDE